MIAADLENRAPGDGLLHPAIIGAVGLLLMNDHILKDMWPGTVTGKLSDFAGLLVFPSLVIAMLEVLGAGLPVLRPRSLRTIAFAATAVVFAAMKTIPLANDLVETAWGLARTPFSSLLGRSSAAVSMTLDPTDLVALLILPLGWVLERRQTWAWMGQPTVARDHLRPTSGRSDRGRLRADP